MQSENFRELQLRNLLEELFNSINFSGKLTTFQACKTVPQHESSIACKEMN